MDAQEGLMPVVCPVCGRDDTIVAIQDLVERDEQDEVLYDADFMEVIESARKLKKWLKKPNEDRYALLSMIPVCFLSCILQIFPSGHKWWQTILIVLGFAAIAAIIVKAVIDQMNWYRAKEHWGRLYYCKRDRLVFDHVTGKTSQPGSMRQLL